MAWSETFEEASFRGLVFDIERITDSRGHSLAKYQAPYTTTVSIEDMGTDPSVYNVRAVITGDDYELVLTALLAALDTPGAGELVHPIYGRIQVNVEKRQVTHSYELVDGCYVDIDFTAAEDTTTQVLFTPALVADEQLYTAVMAQPMARLQQLQSQIEFFDHPLTLADIADRVRAGVRAATAAINGVVSTVNDYLSPPVWIGGLMSDVADLGYAILDPNLSAIGEWRSLEKRLSLLNDIFTSRSDQSPLESAEPLLHVGRTLQVAALAVVSQVIVRQESASTAQTLSANSAIGQAATAPVFTTADLIYIRDSIRTSVQAAITREREQAALLAATQQAAISTPSPPIPLDAVEQVRAYKALADKITQQLNAIINLRPPLQVTLVQQSCNLRLLAHKLYGDHSRAVELQRLNPELINPALIDIGTEVNTYAQ